MIATPPRRLLALLLVLAAVLLSCRGRVLPKRPPNVLLISIDTLRADRLGCYGYDKIETPHIDNLASQGVLFETVEAQSPITLPSHASMFTGLYPCHHGVRDNGIYVLPERHKTLAEILTDAGYATGAVVGGFPLHRQFGTQQGFDVYEDTGMRGHNVRRSVDPERPVDILGTPADRPADGIGRPESSPPPPRARTGQSRPSTGGFKLRKWINLRLRFRQGLAEGIDPEILHPRADLVIHALGSRNQRMCLHFRMFLARSVNRDLQMR